MNLMHDWVPTQISSSTWCAHCRSTRTPALQPTGKASVELSKVSLELDHWGIGWYCLHSLNFHHCRKGPSFSLSYSLCWEHIWKQQSPRHRLCINREWRDKGTESNLGLAPSGLDEVSALSFYKHLESQDVSSSRKFQILINPLVILEDL